MITPGPLQRLHPAQAGRGRQAHAVGQREVGLAAVARKLAQYPVVYVVKLGHLLRIICANARIFAIPAAEDRCKNCAMTHDLFLALLGFAFVTSVTPGPNNMMLLASGVNFGFRRTVPHMLGISRRPFALMVFLVGLGLAGVFKAWPPALTGAEAGCRSPTCCGWRGRSPTPPRPGEGGRGRSPMTFLQAAAFQWVNPKAWAMALGAVSAYVTEPSVCGLCRGGAVLLPA